MLFSGPSFCEQLGSAIEHYGNVTEFAAALHVHQRTVRKWRAGEAHPPSAMIEKIVRLTGAKNLWGAWLHSKSGVLSELELIDPEVPAYTFASLAERLHIDLPPERFVLLLPPLVAWANWITGPSRSIIYANGDFGHRPGAFFSMVPFKRYHREKTLGPEPYAIVLFQGRLRFAQQERYTAHSRELFLHAGSAFGEPDEPADGVQRVPLQHVELLYTAEIRRDRPSRRTRRGA